MEGFLFEPIKARGVYRGVKRLLLILLVSLASVGAAKKRVSWSYFQDPFTVTRYHNEAVIDSPVSDGLQAPLPFTVIKGSLTDHEFRETLIFITDNLSEAYQR